MTEPLLNCTTPAGVAVFRIPPNEECHLKNWSALYYEIDINEEAGYKMREEIVGGR